MAWGRKDEELPERLRGRTPEQIAADLAELDAVKQRATDAEARAQATSAQFETFGNTINELNEKVTELSNRQPARQESNNNGNQREMSSFLTDPDQAFAERAAPLVGLVLSSSAQLAKNEAMRKAFRRQQTMKNNIDGMLFEKFEAEVEALAKGCTAQQLAIPETWEHLYYNVKGRHADEIVDQTRERKGEFFTEGAQRAVADEGGKEDTLTEQEKRICAKMGVSPEKYLANKKAQVTGVPEELVR